MRRYSKEYVYKHIKSSWRILLIQESRELYYGKNSTLEYKRKC